MICVMIMLLSSAPTGILLIFLTFSMRLLLFLFLADEVIEEGETDRDDFDELVDIDAENGDVGEAEFCFLMVENNSSFLSGLLFTATFVVTSLVDLFAAFSLSLLLDTLSFETNCNI